MALIDVTILLAYLIGMSLVGLYFWRKNGDIDDYFVGGRSLGPGHVGISVVATDVGGGFSIGLGGLGFTMGLSGSWLLFTGLLGAWLAAVVLIPKVKGLDQQNRFLTFPQLFHHFFGAKAAVLAAIVTTIGYLGFTSSQLLAGAKLAAATIDPLNLTFALLIMGAIAVIYTALGGIKAVIYTDTVQWIVLMAGLLFIGVPLAHQAVGGWDGIKSAVGPEFLSFTQVGWKQLLNWAVTIIPIWFVGMTLYQRIYACRSAKDAQKAWFLAGVLEFPVIAVLGVLVGLYARVALQQGLLIPIGYGPDSVIDPEIAMPLLLKTVLPAGFLGLVLAAYFSAILSTADSCLMAASGSVVSDFLKTKEENKILRQSQLVTLMLGTIALGLAYAFENVLGLMLHSYSFMVSGLLVPVIMAFFTRRHSAAGACAAIICGGGTTVGLNLLSISPAGLDANFFGIAAATIMYLLFSIGSQDSFKKSRDPLVG